jgi:hypothetical protein
MRVTATCFPVGAKITQFILCGRVGSARHDSIAFRDQILYGLIRERCYVTGTGIAF